MLEYKLVGAYNVKLKTFDLNTKIFSIPDVSGRDL